MPNAELLGISWEARFARSEAASQRSREATLSSEVPWTTFCEARADHMCWTKASGFAFRFVLWLLNGISCYWVPWSLRVIVQYIAAFHACESYHTPACCFDSVLAAIKRPRRFVRLLSCSDLILGPSSFATLYGARATRSDGDKESAVKSLEFHSGMGSPNFTTNKFRAS